jgi:Ca-activated chloride channel family protein
MNGFPLNTAKALLHELTVGLRPQDRFNVLLFSGGSKLMSPRSVPATRENISQAQKLIDRQSGGGGTELLGALQRALALPHEEWMSRTFVLVTDGFIGGEREAFEEIHEHLGQANVFCFGIGKSVNRYLVEGVGKAGLGASFIVTDVATAWTEARRFAQYIEAPLLTNLRLEADGVQVQQVEPASLPDVLADRPVIIHGKWKGPQHGTLRLTGLTGLGPYVASFDLSQVARSEPDGGLDYLWARTRIGNLSDFGLGRSPTQVQTEVTQLGLRYNLLTRFTSFVAVDNAPRAAIPGTDVEQPLPLPEGVSDMAVGAEPSCLACIALAMAAALVLRRRATRAQS